MAVTRHRAAMARKLGVGDSEILAIAHLAQHGELSQVRLAALLDLSSGGTAALVQRLEREGHVTRRATAADRRVRLVALTPSTVRRATAFYEPLVSELDALLAGCDAGGEAIAQFLDALASITERHADELLEAGAGASRAPEVLTPGLWG
jgi:DNA-binding MarR family transcriptional regulator